jgi:hypothetical protein
MVMQASATAASVAAGALLVAAAATGCGNDRSSSLPSSTAPTSPTSPTSAPNTPAAQSGDYSALLIKAIDIVVPGDTFTQAQTLPANPAGIEGVFMNQGGTRKVDITIYGYPDGASASRALGQSVKAIPDLAVTAPTTPIGVGTGGQVAVGPSPDGAKAKAIVMFTEGKASAVLESESPCNDPVHSDFASDFGREQDRVQDAAIRVGLAARTTSHCAGPR